jgi:hypothetical protein
MRSLSSKIPLVFVVLFAITLFSGCRVVETVEKKPTLWLMNLSVKEEEKVVQEFVDERDKEAIDLLRRVITEGVKKHPEDYQSFVAPATSIIEHHENSNEIVW